MLLDSLTRRSHSRDGSSQYSPILSTLFAAGLQVGEQ